MQPSGKLGDTLFELGKGRATPLVEGGGRRRFFPGGLVNGLSQVQEAVSRSYCSIGDPTVSAAATIGIYPCCLLCPKGLFFAPLATS
ncbi:hypothetical protein D3C76_902280 [compost metagenome]